jgi:outer membrane protein assembly factor BamB
MDVLRADTGILLWRYMPHVLAQSLYPQILVSDGVVYAGTHDHHLFALRASDGFKIWNVVPYATDDFFFMNVTDGAVYVEDASNNGIVDALRQSSGSVIWQYVDRSGSSVPITVADGVVYLGLYTTGVNILASITALRASDGVVLWSYTPHTAYQQLLPVLGDDIILIALQDGSVDALYASMVHCSGKAHNCEPLVT